MRYGAGAGGAAKNRILIGVDVRKENMHKVVGYRSREKRGVVTITALTESPRGTHVPFKEVSFSTQGKSKEEFTEAVANAIRQLQAGTLGTG